MWYCKNNKCYAGLGYPLCFCSTSYKRGSTTKIQRKSWPFSPIPNVTGNRQAVTDFLFLSNLKIIKKYLVSINLWNNKQIRGFRVVIFYNGVLSASLKELFKHTLSNRTWTQGTSIKNNKIHIQGKFWDAANSVAIITNNFMQFIIWA